jgi:hypothetical protein
MKTILSSRFKTTAAIGFLTLSTLAYAGNKKNKEFIELRPTERLLRHR